MSCHPKSESLPVGGGQVDEEPDYKQSGKLRKEVRAKKQSKSINTLTKKELT